MEFSETDISAMLTAMGDSVTIAGTDYPCLAQIAGKIVQHFDGSIATTGPVITVSAATAGLVAENSSYVDISGQTWLVVGKLPDGAGMVDIELTRDF